MATQDMNWLTRVDEILAGSELQPQPRGFLLTNMVKFSFLVEPQLAEKYWQQLQPLAPKLSPNLQKEISELTAVMEEALPSTAKGFAAETLAEIQAIRKLEPEEMKRQLLDCELKVKKKFMLAGKGVIWAGLVDAWYPIDQEVAFQLLKNVSGSMQENYITRWNKQKALSEEEWTMLASAVGAPKIAKVVSNILNDNLQTLNLPVQLLTQVATTVLNSMQQFTTPINQAEIEKVFSKYIHLISFQKNGPNADQIPQLIETLYKHLANAPWLESAWMMRFNLIEALSPTFTADTIQRLAAVTPPHMLNFLWAEFHSITCAEEDAKQALADVLSKTKQDAVAEAWFLVKLVKRGFGGKALELAAASPHAQELIARLRRCWVCVLPETAKSKISVQDMSSDPIGEFLLHGNAKERAAYLKKTTLDGKASVPGALWVNVEPVKEGQEKKGFWSSLSTPQKSSDEIVEDYFKQNPLYPVYTIATKKEDQFKEALRINGYGQYRYEEIDKALLETLVVWGNQEPEKVNAVLQAMWQVIRPNDAILMHDSLRNAIQNRCVNVFSADKSILINEYLEWLNIELVKKGRQWQRGKMQFTLRYPPSVLLQSCLIAAITVSAYSDKRKDDLILAGLQKFEKSPEQVELAAKLYNSGKDILDLQPPVTLSPNLAASWQTGIIENAMKTLFNAVIALAAQNQAS